MSRLTLVRHGQATPFEKEKDRLSSTGELQAAILGDFWTRRGLVFDRAFSGTLVRQRRTAALVAEKFAGAGIPWPMVEVLEELNEYDVESVLTRALPVLAEEEPALGALMEARDREASSPDRNRHLQRLFEAVMIRWVRGDRPVPGVKPWSEWREDVRRGIRRIIRAVGPGKSVVAFTSGGPIGVAVQLALGAPDRAALELNWRVRNCSLTEFVFSGDRFSLDIFNAIPHLEDPGLWTFR